MTSKIMNFDFNIVISCLSQEMIDKLEYAIQALIKEFLILKNDEEEKGNKKTYRWLNETYKIRGRVKLCRVQPITRIIDEIFLHKSNILLSVISDYVAPEDVDMLKIFSDNYNIHKHMDSQEQCEQTWSRLRSTTPEDFNPTTYPIMMFKHAMYYYMQLNTEFIRHNLFNVVDNNKYLVQLK